MVRNRLSRYAFTLIELIFAIVIISIAVMSLPVMARITSKGIESNILQEAIFAGSAELMGASAGYWDTNSMQDNNVSHMSRVIDINPGAATSCLNNTASDRHRLRPGHVAQPLHRRCVDSTAGTLAGASDAVYPDLNDAAHGIQDIFLNPDTAGVGVADRTGYKDIYKSSLTVTYTNNIKFLTVTVTKPDGVTPITILRMQSANIGEIDYYKRRF